MEFIARKVINKLRKKKVHHSGKLQNWFRAPIKWSKMLLSHRKLKHFLLKQERKTNCQTDHWIIHTSKSDPYKSSKHINDELNLNASTRLISRWIVEINLKATSARRVYLLSRINDRLKLSKIHEDWKGDGGIKKILWKRWVES